MQLRYLVNALKNAGQTCMSCLMPGEGYRVMQLLTVPDADTHVPPRNELS